jgi:hypothetical protein
MIPDNSPPAPLSRALRDLERTHRATMQAQHERKTAELRAELQRIDDALAEADRAGQVQARPLSAALDAANAAVSTTLANLEAQRIREEQKVAPLHARRNEIQRKLNGSMPEAEWLPPKDDPRKDPTAAA